MSKKRRTPEESARRERWVESRFKINEAIRRFRDLSSDAYKLWAELAFGWAWDEPFCYPNYEVIAQALGWPRNRVALTMNELVTNGLIERQRRSFGYRYTLVVDLPLRFWTNSLNNKELVGDLRKRKLSRRKSHDASTGVHHDTFADASTGRHHDASTGMHHGVSDASTGMHHDASTGVDPYKQMNLEADEHLREADELEEKPVPSSPASETTLGMRDSSGNEGSTDPMAEAEDLIAEDEAPLTTKGLRRKSKKRAPSAALVSWDDQPRVAYPEALGSSQSNAGIRFDAPPPPPPVDRPDDVLSLLRGEVENKWGKKGARGFAMELTGELSGKITNTILRKYPPDVILSMVRLLVWDWEVARGVCFPPRKDVAYPDVTALVQYAKELAARIETGFDYMASRRGALNTYHDLFIRKLDFIPDDDPF